MAVIDCKKTEFAPWLKISDVFAPNIRQISWSKVIICPKFYVRMVLQKHKIKAAEARSAGAHRVSRAPLSKSPDLVDLSRVLQGLVLQKIVGRALANVLHSSR
jgi:hypothetical protein